MYAVTELTVQPSQAGDIAVDAACGMALSGLEKPSGGWSEEQPPRFPAAAMRALSRRIEKALR